MALFLDSGNGVVFAARTEAENKPAPLVETFTDAAARHEATSLILIGFDAAVAGDGLVEDLVVGGFDGAQWPSTCASSSLERPLLGRRQTEPIGYAGDDCRSLDVSGSAEMSAFGHAGSNVRFAISLTDTRVIMRKAEATLRGLRSWVKWVR
ncbi:hypothetical protein AB0M36_25470 [Actinoplanes sp. NPDC051346]|uniref:hypothetical protein n=1 Tax=Actinoplanes sp. NPDC051346 TaxID=3155048 RepID=UPI0034378030